MTQGVYEENFPLELLIVYLVVKIVSWSRLTTAPNSPHPQVCDYANNTPVPPLDTVSTAVKPDC